MAKIAVRQRAASRHDELHECRRGFLVWEHAQPPTHLHFIAFISTYLSAVQQAGSRAVL
ncbi:MAG: hypothetical protein HY735_30565 [Verrucomicrobia bacterium]|nr:hypothetical protein [Verrucomicrobiota bacterium]